MPPPHTYPDQALEILDFPGQLADLFPEPPGLVEDTWPPTQVSYIDEYLRALGCRSVVVESHYVDRDYIHDLSLFYGRSLRAYPNHCRRLHFLREPLTTERWRELVISRRVSTDAQTWLQEAYLGFMIIRPLPGSPVGRTVLKTFTNPPADGGRRLFGGTRRYTIHLAGFEMDVEGLAFQQQDQGVSACATTALWSSLNRVAPAEGFQAPTPAEITESASRYFLADGRALPSEGLTIHQICEAIRAVGLAPIVVKGVGIEHDRAQLLGYVSSGLPPVLAIRELRTGLGHAVAAVGVKLGDLLPKADASLHYRDAASAVRGVYIHDDRLGPYAIADLYSHTVDGQPRTALRIRWPGAEVETEHSLLTALVVPMPVKMRLTLARMRSLGYAIADAAGTEFHEDVDLDCRYMTAADYKVTAAGFGLSEDGMYQLMCGVTLSRHLGVIEIRGASGPLFDVLLDSTETRANPSVLACVRREGYDNRWLTFLQFAASKLGGAFVA